MKIAVAYENGQIFQHFGHTEQFKLYEAVDGKITHAKVVDTNGSGHGALAVPCFASITASAILETINFTARIASSLPGIT